MSDEKYRHVERFVAERAWAILPSMLATIVDSVRGRAAGGPVTGGALSWVGEQGPERIVATRDGIVARTSAPPTPQRPGSVAVLPIRGVISQHSDMWMELFGGTSVDAITASLRECLADSSIDAIVLDVSSPGGTVDGIPELAAEIRAARGTKPIVAVANGLAASAAYWLASQADELVITPSGSVGSIGVFAAHADLSAAAEMEGIKTTLISAGKYKTEANPWGPLGEEAQAHLQSQVDEYYSMFTADVARGRGVPIDSVRKGYGEGRVVMARQALAQGMVDRVDTLDNTVRRVARGVAAGRNSASIAALDPELPFTARLALVSAAATELVGHASARLDMRAKDGRTFTAADRTGLLAVADALRGLAAEEPVVEESPEQAAPSTAWKKVAANRLALSRAEYQI